MHEQKVDTTAPACLDRELSNDALGSVRLTSSCTAAAAVVSGTDGMAVFAAMVGSASLLPNLANTSPTMMVEVEVAVTVARGYLDWQ